MNKQNVASGIERAHANVRVTKKQGKLLVDQLELTSKQLDNCLRSHAGLVADLQAEKEFSQRVCAEINEIYHVLDELLNVKMSGICVKGEAEFRWEARDATTGELLVSGHKSIAEAFKAVLVSRLPVEETK